MLIPDLTLYFFNQLFEHFIKGFVSERIFLHPHSELVIDYFYALCF